MSDQFTRAQAADPRQSFTLDATQGALIRAAIPNGQAFLNQSWSDLGGHLGFVWTTIGDMEELPDGGFSFTAWPSSPAAWTPDPDAVAWLEGMVVDGDAGALRNRELILRAWAAGRDTGFAMGAATVPAPGAGWDGMELLREAAVALKAAPILTHHILGDKLLAFLADPAQSHLVHDGLREARQDSERAVAAGWRVAMEQVQGLMRGGFIHAADVVELAPPENVDEVLEPFRQPLASLAAARTALADLGEPLQELRDARRLPTHVRTATDAENVRWAVEAARSHKEWLAKTIWVDEVLRADVFKNLGLPPQWGRHKADTLRTLVERLVELLGDTLLGAMGLSGKRADRVVVDDPHAAPIGHAVGDSVEVAPGEHHVTVRLPIGEGLECAAKPAYTKDRS